MPALTDPLTLGGVALPNRVTLAPMANIGNWFVRLQARRHGAGLVTSEMVSSHAIHHGNPRTHREMLRVHPDEHPVAFQLFGADVEVMRSAAATVAAMGADLIDLNMGCPVRKVCKTGAGAALLDDPGRAVALARAAHQASGLPVTAKLRCALRPGERHGLDLARRLVEDAGVAGIAMHPRHASQRHGGRPDYALISELAQLLPGVPVTLSGGLREPEAIRAAFDQTGAAAVMLARGALGNPWLFGALTGRHNGRPTPAEVLTELDWVLDAAVAHVGAERAARYLRKFYPWYVERVNGDARLQEALQRSVTVEQAREHFRVYADGLAVTDEALRTAA